MLKNLVDVSDLDVSDLIGVKLTNTEEFSELLLSELPRTMIHPENFPALH